MNDFFIIDRAPYPLTVSNSTSYIIFKRSNTREGNYRSMDGLQQLGLPVLGIVAAAAITFYVVSFSELSEVRFQVSLSLSLSLR